MNTLLLAVGVGVGATATMDGWTAHYLNHAVFGAGLYLSARCAQLVL